MVNIMKNQIVRSLIAMAAIFWVSHTSSEAKDTLVLPDDLNQMISDAMKIKRDAMEFPAMRSQEGILGDKFSKIIDAIGSYPMDAEFVGNSEKLKDSDISAKIIFWALDRKKRRNEYDRFEKFYVNQPTTNEDKIDHFLRSYPEIEKTDEAMRNALLIRFIDANPVTASDAVEVNRSILEYFYFSPPTGKAFHNDIWRGNLNQALYKLGDFDKSFIVWEVDLQTTLNAPPTHAERTRGATGNVYGAIQPFVDITSQNSLKVLASHWDGERAQKATKWLFQNCWEERQSRFDEVTYIEAKKHYDAWMTLAREDWKTPGEKAFAEWLKQQAPPKAPPPPKYADDPNDPFLPQRPSE